MKLISEIKKAIWAKYQTSTLYTVDHIDFFLDHTPNATVYPLIVCYHVSSGNFMAMPTQAHGNFDYVDSRFQFNVYGNEYQHADIEDIADQLEDLYHRSTLTLGNGCTHIVTISLNQNTTFYDEQQKIWGIRLDMRIIAGT